MLRRLPLEAPADGSLSVVLVEVVEGPVDGGGPGVLDGLAELRAEVLHRFFFGEIHYLGDEMISQYDVCSCGSEKAQYTHVAFCYKSLKVSPQFCYSITRKTRKWSKSW